MAEQTPALLVVSAHAGDFVWRAGGAIAEMVAPLSAWLRVCVMRERDQGTQTGKHLSACICRQIYSVAVHLLV